MRDVARRPREEGRSGIGRVPIRPGGEIGEEGSSLGRSGGRDGDEREGCQKQPRDQNTEGPAMPLVTVSSMILMSNHMDQCSM